MRNIDLGCGREFSGQRHAPAALPPGKRPGAHCTTGWGRYGQVRKISPPTRGFETRTAKSFIESLYRLRYPDAYCRRHKYSGTYL